MKNLLSIFAKKPHRHAVRLLEPSVNIEQQLFNEVYSAHDLLIAKSNEGLKDCNFSDEERQRLTALTNLGFNQTKEVKHLLATKNMEGKRAALEYYRQEYPLNRFIDSKTVKAICEKYALVLAAAARYTADIPVKNQREIVNFKVKRKDISKDHDPRYPTIYLIYDDLENNEKVAANGLMIMAPENKIDMQGYTLMGRVVVKDDPIVLQPVRFGYLIVSSWGLEASDPAVTNAINN